MQRIASGFPGLWPHGNWDTAVSSGAIPGVSRYRKFGYTAPLPINNRTSLWDFSDVIPTHPIKTTLAPVISQVSSSSSLDVPNGVGGYLVAVVSGISVDGCEVTQNIVLTGQTPATIPSPFRRVNRVQMVDTRGSLAGAAGEIYVFEQGVTVTNGVPDDLTKVWAGVRYSQDGVNPEASTNQTQMLIYSAPCEHLVLITGFFLTQKAKAQGAIQVTSKIRSQLAEQGVPWTTKISMSVSANGNTASSEKYSFPVPLPDQSDLLVEVTSGTLNTAVACRLEMLLYDREVYPDLPVIGGV